MRQSPFRLRAPDWLRNVIAGIRRVVNVVGRNDRTFAQPKEPGSPVAARL
jgi:hypothetical protein